MKPICMLFCYPCVSHLKVEVKSILRINEYLKLFLNGNLSMQDNIKLYIFIASYYRQIFMRISKWKIIRLKLVLMLWFLFWSSYKIVCNSMLYIIFQSGLEPVLNQRILTGFKAMMENLLLLSIFFNFKNHQLHYYWTVSC